MIPEPTPEQKREFENAVKIGDILSSTIDTPDSPNLFVNPLRAGDAVAIYKALGANKPFLQSAQQFVMNCLLYNGETFAACSYGVVIFYRPTPSGLAYWYGNGKLKDWEPIPNVKCFEGANSSLFALVIINHSVFSRLQHLLAPQPNGP